MHGDPEPAAEEEWGEVPQLPQPPLVPEGRPPSAGRTPPRVGRAPGPAAGDMAGQPAGAEQPGGVAEAPPADARQDGAWQGFRPGRAEAQPAGGGAEGDVAAGGDDECISVTEIELGRVLSAL